ncbi:hypothetical protein [Aureimonas mangrovi]|uniref:hypothetical protein n=1 Tax=Aureimonas mangrovi TaxID=2758041 RepID=UPI00163D476B|nr:hypothetical protein [Aureimonas mangrovi]
MTDLSSGQSTRQFTTIFIDAYRIRGGDTPGSGAYVVAFEDRLAWGLGEADDLEAFFAHGLEHALTLLGEDHGPIRLRFFAWRSSFTRRIRRSAPMWIARGGLKANGEPVPHFAMWSKLHGMLEAGDLKLAYGGRREAGALGKAATAKLEDCLARVRALGLHAEDGIVERGIEQSG